MEERFISILFLMYYACITDFLSFPDFDKHLGEHRIFLSYMTRKSKRNRLRNIHSLTSKTFCSTVPAWYWICQSNELGTTQLSPILSSINQPIDNKSSSRLLFLHSPLSNHTIAVFAPYFALVDLAQTPKDDSCFCRWFVMPYPATFVAMPNCWTFLAIALSVSRGAFLSPLAGVSRSMV